MANQFSTIAFTDAVKEIQSLMGSRKNYARAETGAVTNHELTEKEIQFIAEREFLYVHDRRDWLALHSTSRWTTRFCPGSFAK